MNIVITKQVKKTNTLIMSPPKLQDTSYIQQLHTTVTQTTVTHNSYTQLLQVIID